MSLGGEAEYQHYIKSSVNRAKPTFDEREFAREIQERLLKTYLDILVIAETNKIGFMKITWMISILKNKFFIQISPGALYPLFAELERKEFIKMVSNRPARLYVLTNKGKKLLESFRDNIMDNQHILKELAQNTSNINNKIC